MFDPDEDEDEDSSSHHEFRSHPASPQHPPFGEDPDGERRVRYKRSE